VDDHAFKDTRFSAPKHILAHKALPIPANPTGWQKLPKRIVSSCPYVQAVAVRKIVTETARGRDSIQSTLLPETAGSFAVIRGRRDLWRLDDVDVLWALLGPTVGVEWSLTPGALFIPTYGTQPSGLCHLSQG
jgi:hypothetical protein